MFATLSLKHSILDEIHLKKAVKASIRSMSRARFEVNVAFACDVAGLGRSVYYHKCKRPPDDDVLYALLALVERHPGGAYQAA